MNQILCGDDVIDTDDIRNAIKITGEDAQRRVFFKRGGAVILRGEAEKDFDKWAAMLPRAGERADLPEALRLDEHVLKRMGRGTADPTELARGLGYVGPPRA